MPKLILKTRSFNMIITIKNEEGEISYDVNNIKDEGKQG